VPARVHALMIAPTLLAALIVPVHESVRQSRWEGFRRAHPAIAENHVNLSGREIWLDMRGASSASPGLPFMPPASAEERRFARFHRYPSADALASGGFPYDAARLRPDVQRYVYRQEDGSPGESLPLRRRPYPDNLERLASAAGGEAALLVHQYFHHGDHVEVAPGIARFAFTTEEAVAAARIPGLAIFSLENHTDQTIARMEVSGQTLDLGEYAARSLRNRPCHDRPVGSGAALVDLAQPLRVRWQTLESPRTWHEAQVTVPGFGPAGDGDPGTALTRVRLYALPDGQLAAERYREIRQRDSLSLRTTGVPAQAAPHAVCGGAYAGYDPQTVRLLRD
jgi:hypothetical protein